MSSRNLNCTIQKPLSIIGIEEVPTIQQINFEDMLSGLTPEQLERLREMLGVSTKIEWKYLS